MKDGHEKLMAVKTETPGKAQVDLEIEETQTKRNTFVFYDVAPKPKKITLMRPQEYERKLQMLRDAKAAKDASVSQLHMGH